MCVMLLCIRTGFVSDYEHHGCSLKVLLDWAWECVSKLKSKIDSVCKYLNMISHIGQLVEGRTCKLNAVGSSCSMSTYILPGKKMPSISKVEMGNGTIYLQKK